MSENINLVRSLFADWERGDFGQVVKVVVHGLPDRQTFEGVEGLRVGWLEWLAP